MQAATTRTPSQPLMAHAVRSLIVDAGARGAHRSGLGVDIGLDNLIHDRSLGSRG